VCTGDMSNTPHTHAHARTHTTHARTHTHTCTHARGRVCQNLDHLERNFLPPFFALQLMSIIGGPPSDSYAMLKRQYTGLLEKCVAYGGYLSSDVSLSLPSPHCFTFLVTFLLCSYGTLSRDLAWSQQSVNELKLGHEKTAMHQSNHG
jgi:hypothetical protein